MLDFPASPTIGQQYTAAGVTWVWDGVKWLPSGLSPTVVPGINDNRIINGDMRIDQRNAGAVGTATGYTVDRWAYYDTQPSKGSWQRTGPAAAPVGFPYALFFQSLSAYVSSATDVFELLQAIEADMVSDFAWGTANAQPVTLSFWAWSTLAGTFSGAILNYAATRSYPFSYSLPTANTWTKIIITIPGDTGGAWVMSGNSGAFYLIFDLGCGSTVRGTANAWQAGAFYGVTGSVSVVGTNNAAFQVTGVKLETGSVATPFNRQSLSKSLADCQRYYEKSYNAEDTPGTATIVSGEFLYASGAGSGLAGGGMSTRFSVAKRVQPTITVYSGLTGSPGAIFDQNSNVDVAATMLSLGTKSFGWYGAPSVGDGINFLIQWTADAEL